MNESTLKMAKKLSSNKPKVTMAHLHELAESRVNGNITWFKEEVQKLHSSDLIILLTVLEEYGGYSSEEAKRIMLAATL